MPSSISNKGVNDLATLHPELAAEAEIWDPSIVLPGSNKNVLEMQKRIYLESYSK